MQATISVKTLTLGEQATNCYVIWSRQTGEGYVIDPADAGDVISQFLLEEKIKIQGILLTHGHFDHLLALLELQLNFPVPAHLHPADQFLLARAHSTAKYFLGHAVDPVPTATLSLTDGQAFAVDSAELTVIHTPGHTPGSVCMLVKAKDDQIEINQVVTTNKAILFTGDTLFAAGVEPLTHQYSDALALSKSLQRLDALGKDILMLAGHGESAVLAEALQNHGLTAPA